MSVPWFRFAFPYRMPAMRASVNNGVVNQPIPRKMPPVKPTDTVAIPRWVLAFVAVTFVGVFSWAVSLSYRAELATETRVRVMEIERRVNLISVDMEIIKHRLQTER